MDDNLLGFIDPALGEIANSGISTEPYLHDFAMFLAKGAPDRGPVKFAIALLGIMRYESDKEVISVLGRHEEFTLYSAVALSNLLPNPDLELWDLAKMVDGWGRIHLVERLAGTELPQIKDWLLLGGFRNYVMNEYLAYTCATKGDLKSALESEDASEELLKAAGEIIEALISGGPAKDIDDYEDAAPVISDYLYQLERRASSIDEFNTVNSILQLWGMFPT